MTIRKTFIVDRILWMNIGPNSEEEHGCDKTSIDVRYNRAETVAKGYRNGKRSI